jgi:transcriptional regulator with XRE-family HTH domain
MFKIVGGVNMKFGETLKNLREIKGITQKDLGKILGVSRATIAGYETKNHQPDYEKLETLSHFFDVSIDYLLTGEDSFHIERMKRPIINEKVLDTEVIKVYKTLPPETKQDVLKYLKLLQLNEKYTKKDV